MGGLGGCGQPGSSLLYRSDGLYRPKNDEKKHNAAQGSAQLWTRFARGEDLMPGWLGGKLTWADDGTRGEVGWDQLWRRGTASLVAAGNSDCATAGITSSHWLSCAAWPVNIVWLALYKSE